MKANKKDIISILLGNTLLALAVILFIVPGHLLSGGTTGISLFLNHYFHLPISLFTFIFNFITNSDKVLNKHLPYNLNL